MALPYMGKGAPNPSSLGSLFQGFDPSQIVNGASGSVASYMNGQLLSSAEKTTGRDPNGDLMSSLPAWAQGLQIQAEATRSRVVPIPPGNWADIMGEPVTDGGQGNPKHTQSRTRTKNVYGSTWTISQAENQPYGWDEKQITAAITKMQKAGLKVTGFQDLVSAWGMLVNRASSMFAANPKSTATPWDVLDLYKNEAVAAGTYSDLTDPNNPKGLNFTGTKTHVTKSVNDLTEGQSWATLQGSLSNMLGRDPTDHELRDFASRMSTAAARNPSVTKTAANFKDGTQVGSTTSRTSGGFTVDDAHQAAYQSAQNSPGYGAYQAASTYFNSLQTALGAIGGP